MRKIFKLKLETLFASFDKKCKKLEKRAFDILNQKYAISQWEFNYLSETLISDLWQAWCNFCRELLLLSCRGTKDRNGNVILKLNRDNSRNRILYEVSQNKSNSHITANGHNNFKNHKDITWGDMSYLINAIQYLSPRNEAKLLSSFGSTTILKELQLVRNCIAHKNKESLDNIRNLDNNFSHRRSFCCNIASNSSNICILLSLFI